MPLTTKDSPGLAAQKPVETASEAPTKKFGRTVKPIPVCLEIPVTVRGTRPKPGTTAVTPEMEPFSEETRTVIVFEKGGVLRLNGALSAGQTMTVVNSRSGAEAGCRVVNTRNFPSVKGYVEVEFVEPAADFWGVHFPGDANASATSSAPAEPAPAEPVEVDAVPVPVVAQKSSPLDVATSTAEFWSTRFTPDEMAAPEPPRVAPRAPAVPIVEASAAAPATPQAATPSQESSGTHGAGPSFEDLNGLGLLPPPARRQSPRSPQPATPDSTFSRGIEDTQHLADSVSPAPAVVRESRPERSTPIRTPAPLAAHSVVAAPTFTGGLLASAAAAERSSGSGKKIWLAAAGMILVAGGAVAGVLYWHGRQDSYTVASHVVAPAPLTSAPASSAAPPSSPADFTVHEAAKQPEPAASSASNKETLPVEREVPKSGASSRVETVGASEVSHAAALKPPVQPPQKRPALTNLKMSAPIGTKTASNSAPPVLDAVSTEPGSALPAGISTALPAIMQADQAPAPPPPQIETRIVEGGKITPPRAISAASPQYPAMARQAHISGDVVVDAQVDVNGRVVSAQAVDGPTALRQAAVNAVRQWKYAPAMLDGAPTPAHIMVTVKFRLQ